MNEPVFINQKESMALLGLGRDNFLTFVHKHKISSINAKYNREQLLLAANGGEGKPQTFVERKLAKEIEALQARNAELEATLYQISAIAGIKINELVTKRKVIVNEIGSINNMG
ncbi:hypothetical protein [Phascolarctobacterium faecium]|uniref:hypothetical protein n=1 Tax=Phascolarctobacterium faecium TaxID=33025 RepID=UPI003AB76777